MELVQKVGEARPDAKKRRRVGFTQIDSGIEAKDCIRVFLVRSQDEVGVTTSFCIDPVDLNQFFGEDGKIYGYKDLKINVWFSTISFQGYSEITFESTFDVGKGITDLKSALQNIFGETLLEKEEFLQTFTTQARYIRTIMSDGVVIPCTSKEMDYASEAHSSANGLITEFQVIRMNLHAMPVGLLYSRLVPLILLLVEGGSPVDVTDPKWDIYFVVKKLQDQSGDYNIDLLGFATVYHFYHHPDSTRLRVGQILVSPAYEGQGHDLRLLDAIDTVAVSENVYDITFEEPSDHLQYLRACGDTHRLLEFEPIKPAINLIIKYLKESNLSKRTSKSSTYRSRFGPPKHAIDVVRQKLKINKKQFIRCWDVLVYLNLDQKNRRCMDNFNACVSNRVKGDIIDKDLEATRKRLVEVPNEYDHDMTFVVTWSETDGESEEKVEADRGEQEDAVKQVVEKQIEEIVEIAKEVSSHRR